MSTQARIHMNVCESMFLCMYEAAYVTDIFKENSVMLVIRFRKLFKCNSQKCAKNEFTIASSFSKRVHPAGQRNVFVLKLDHYVTMYLLVLVAYDTAYGIQSTTFN